MLTYPIVFFVLGGFNLARLAWGDMKELLVDQRISSLMTGVVLCLYLLEGRVLELLVVAFVALFALGEIKKHTKLLGIAEGDITIMSWVLPGLWFIGLNYLIQFLFLYVLGLIVMRYLIVKANNFPASVPICIAFCLTWTLGVLA